MKHEFHRVAIVNRGEAAMRFIHAAHEFNLEFGTSLRTIALFTDPDCHSLFVREADEAVHLGPAQSIDSDTRQAKSSYVDYGRLERALAVARADAVWVGWGFVAEHAEFADLCRELGIVFIGPDGDVMRRLGDKISSKRLAEEAQVAVAPWGGGAVETLADAWHHAERLGYPFLIKATAGGGGHGIRAVYTPNQLPEAFESARAQAFKAFGNPTVFIEQLVHGARHVEVQVIGDHYGTTWAAGVRDCTIQRRHQKIMEEAPSPVLSAEQDQALREAAVRISRAAGYHNAGTVEFLYEPESQRFLFMEMNTRLQVEHPVTECTTGLDLVKLQIRVSQGHSLEGEPPRTHGHAIEVRLNAEDPDNDFAPAPGAIERFRILTGPGVRIDTGVAVGDVVPREFDSMLAKIIGYGQTRQEALARLRRALRESVVVIKGGASNKAFLLELLEREEVQRSAVDVGWLGRLSASGEHLSQRHAKVALVQAAIEVYDACLAVEQKQFYSSAVRGRPSLRSEVGRPVALRYRGNPYSFKVFRLGPKSYRLETEASRIDGHLDRLGQFEYWLTAFGKNYNIVSVVQGLSHRIEVDGVSHRVDRDDNGVVYAPAPAVVVSIAVKPGDRVSAGDPLAVLEAMKMEMGVSAPFGGKVRKVMTIPNVQVDTGTALLQIVPDRAEGGASSNAPRVAFGGSPQSGPKSAVSRCLEILEELRQFMLGFDFDPSHSTRLLGEWNQGEAAVDAKELKQAEDEILNIFVDICSLFKREPEIGDPAGGETPSAEAHLFTYLRMLETRGEGLPPAFVEALKRALAHYGICSLDRSPELEESLLWIYKSHLRVDQQVAPVVAVLERRLSLVDSAVPPADESFRPLLDRMISVARGVFPAVSDLARELRYRYFDQPLFDTARREAYARAEEHLAYLAGNPLAEDRYERVRALVECPQPLVSVFCGRFASARPPVRQLMLEVLTSRYYRVQTLQNLQSLTLGDQCYVVAEYDDDGRHVHLFTTHSDYGRLSEAAQAMAPLFEGLPPAHDLVIDLYVWHAGSLADAEATQLEVRDMLNRAHFPRAIERIVAAVGGPGRGSGIAAMQHFTYRPGENGYEEVEFLRGLHPMMGKRLNLWRLTNFKVKRLPSVEDVYLIHGVAQNNPKDERLFALAEVRDLTPVRDGSGRIVHLPHLERMFSEALAGIRLFQSRRAPQDRLYGNRVLLYVWPPLDLRPDELNDIARSLAPATEGLGLEQVVVRGRIPNPETNELREMVLRISNPAGVGLLMTFRPATKLQPLTPLTEYDQKVVRLRKRGLTCPYEIVKMLTPPSDDTRSAFPPGDFREYDLDAQNCLVRVDRPYGGNRANVVVGVIRNFTAEYPEGMMRIALLGDPGGDLGAIAEPECRRIIAALDLAEHEGVPLEWFPISAGAKISMESGVENMDWIARVLRRLVEFTQAGGEVNLVVNGINVGAQPYWNAEATMLMHTKGILIMTPQAAMVLTGKRALDFSGSVSAEDNQGIGGYDRVMGLNGEAQYWARDLEEACRILLRHYEHTYVAPGERFPRRAASIDPFDRNVQDYSHGRQEEFARVGEIFSDETNPGRKKSFDIRRVMKAVVDQDHPPLERWSGMQAAEIAVIWDAHLGGYPVCMIGIESRPLPRLGMVPADGPDQWTAGTLFPLSSKKIARAINAASRNRPVVLLANLSGFDGSPESLRKLQLEYGAEIGRAVVNFKGPIIFCVISRYHGGAYVVFSRALNENLEIMALEGTYASVIGGAPAAAVVFSGEVEKRTRKDVRVENLQRAMTGADGAEKAQLCAEWNEMYKIVRSEKLGQVAEEFDRVHSIHRALRVGALHHIIPPAHLRLSLIEAIERGVEKEMRRESDRRETKLRRLPEYRLTGQASWTETHVPAHEPARIPISSALDEVTVDSARDHQEPAKAKAAV